MKYSIAILVMIITLSACKEKMDKKPEPIKEESVIEVKSTRTPEKAEFKKIDSSRIPTSKFVDLTKIPDSLELIADTKLIADFNGDNRADFASMVINLNNRKKGVLIIHDTKIQEEFVFGAGKEINEMTDLSWIEIFEIMHKGQVISPTMVDEVSGDILGQDEEQEFVLIGNGIYMTVEESHGGGILFWNGTEYQWFHTE